MKTIGWGIVQIPIISHYRVCFCLKRDLVNCVTGTGWKMFLQSALRISLLTLWGMNNIDYSLPQTDYLIIGVYVELAVLGLQVLDGMVTLGSGWCENMYMLYPCLVIIPISFLIDVGVKATCYGGLFLWPVVTTFGIFSLIEVWFRYLSLLYCWIAVISFIYYSRGIDQPFAKPESEDKPVRQASRASSARNPFSRSSTLSRRGRRSFLLRGKPEEDKDQGADQALIHTSSHSSSSTPSRHGNEHSNQLSINDDATETLINPALGSSPSNPSTPTAPSSIGEPPIVPVRNKRKGGFIPGFLRNQQPTEMQRSISNEVQESKKTKSKKPTLPSLPPVGSTQHWGKTVSLNLFSASKTFCNLTFTLQSGSLPSPNPQEIYKPEESFFV
uniref:Uncharacterized protein LOC100183718 n=1 Tax=Phallusia mammillata TaxID=59560 RepID=A0A6F9DIK6_9ASCI|nr:uncharacterized protein LOC100183718 [Phallusia mammillata]